MNAFIVINSAVFVYIKCSLNRGQFFKVQRVIGDESDIYNGISEISKLGCRLDHHGCFQKIIMRMMGLFSSVIIVESLFQ